ncbi:MAG TPA: hypothetical protein VK446_10780 [Methylocystis sp.]|nr:hypothetical protein [Methylocystis sp.]
MTQIASLAKETYGVPSLSPPLPEEKSKSAALDFFAPDSPRLKALAFALGVAALWLAFHAYHGVVNDGRYYAVQALNALHPERYVSDLYFRYGSQDAFTTFSLLYRPLIAALGLDAAHRLTTFVGEILWLCSLVYFVRTLFPDRREALFAIAAAIAARSEYGGFFGYGEPVATPRLFAEPLVVIALTFSITGRWAFACVAIGVAAALHPIVALTGAAALGLWGVQRDRRLLLLAAAGAALALALGALSVQPFARLFQAFDPEWFEIVRQRCAFGLMTRWWWSHIISGVATLSVAALCLKWRHDEALRSLALACAVASLLGLALTFLGGDIGHDILVVNSQPWRCLWLSRLMANIILGVLALRAPREGESRWLLGAALALSVLARLHLCLPLIADLAMLGAAGFYWLETRSERPVHPWIRRACLILFAVAALSSPLYASIYAGLPSLPGDIALFILGVAIFGLLLAQERELLRGVTAAMASGLALTAALALNDQSSDWQSFLDRPGAPSDLVQFVGDKPNLYWDDSPELLWFKLGRPSYYSCLQGTGAMFYRETAIDYARRSRALARLNTHDFAGGGDWICYEKADRTAASPKSIDDIRAACRDLPDLDGVVLTVAMPGAPVQSWTSPAERIYVNYPDPDRIKTYYKYDCHDLR